MKSRLLRGSAMLAKRRLAKELQRNFNDWPPDMNGLLKIVLGPEAARAHKAAQKRQVQKQRKQTQVIRKLFSQCPDVSHLIFKKSSWPTSQAKNRSSLGRSQTVNRRIRKRSDSERASYSRKKANASLMSH